MTASACGFNLLQTVMRGPNAIAMATRPIHIEHLQGNYLTALVCSIGSESTRIRMVSRWRVGGTGGLPSDTWPVGGDTHCVCFHFGDHL